MSRLYPSSKSNPLEAKIEDLENNAGIAVEDIESAQALVDDIYELVLEHVVSPRDRNEFYVRINAINCCLNSAESILEFDENPKEDA